MQEIERKYLLKDSITSLIKQYTLKKHKITQYYTTITPLKGIRYRKMDDRYFKTIKQGTGVSREEEELEIPKKMFQKKLKKSIKKPIQKERYLFDFEGNEYIIDVFKKELKGLYLLEVEFPDIESFETFDLPKILQVHVIKDVSFDESFKNKNLVLNGKPGALSELDKIFIQLDSKNHHELDGYYVPNLSPIDALRVILYKFSLSILYYKERILDHHEIEDLHQFRVNIRKSRAFLKAFAFLFPEQEYSYFNETLSYFASQTNQKRDLDVIAERLKDLDESQNLIQEDITIRCNDEQRKIAEMLQSNVFENFFHIYHNALTNESLLTSYNTEGNIENIARKVIENLHTDIIKKINALEKDFSNKKLHKIRVSLKKLRYLLEEFQHIFGETKIEKMIEKGKELQTLLGDFNDVVNQSKLLHDYFKSQKKNMPKSQELEHRLLETTSKSQQKLLLQTRKKLHKFKKKAFKL